MTQEVIEPAVRPQASRETGAPRSEAVLPAQARREMPRPQRGEPDAEKPVDPRPPAANGQSDGVDKRRSFLGRQRLSTVVAAAGLFAVVFGGVFLYWDHARHFESTDDAFVAARQFAIAPKVPGYLSAVPVTDNQHVAANDVIARIDDRDFRTALDQAEAQVAAGQAGIQSIEAQIDVQQSLIAQSQAQVEQTRASLVFAQQQATRYGELAQQGWGPVQTAQQTASTLQQQEAALKNSQAALETTQRQLATLHAQHASAEASLAQATAERDQARLNLSYTTIMAAQPGRVVALTAAVGEYVAAGTSLTMFVPDEIWVDANYKETQLSAMRPGQHATMRIDAYPAREIHGHVASVQPGSGTAFSLLPAENATGNFVKITQRVPVKLIIDNPPPGCFDRAGYVGCPDGSRRSHAVAVRAAEEVAVSDAAVAPGAAAASTATNPWLIAMVVATASFMEVLDTTIANVALPYIAGGLGVSEDEASWVVTTYLVANAISVTASSFLARRFSRKAFFMACLGLFTVSSVACGFAWNLQALLFFRILQGLGGGGMVPVALSILADSFPPEKRGQAFAVYGVAVVVAPVVGPTLGGWLSDNYSWHWCFLINGPVGGIAIALVAMLLTRPKLSAAEQALLRAREGGFDVIGFFLVATFLGALELVLDRGLEDDWFSSTFITSFTILSAGAFLLMIPWEATRAHPLIDVRLLATRQFGACFVVMLATGAILLATTQFLPELVQQQFGYTATWAGLVLSPGGLVTLATVIVISRISSRVQPKYLISAGAIIAALSMYGLTNVYGDLDFWFFADSRMLLGLGLPLLFIPITAASYDGISKDKTDMASALINVARNTGGSIGVSIGSNVLAHREQFHQARLAESIIPSSPEYQETMRQASDFFVAQGSLPVEAGQQAFAWIGEQVENQAAFLAYVDVFWVLMVIALATVPLALSLRKIKLGGGAPAGH
ncbi:MAG: DHA2 family efflux MFS transporter permease subunit [Acetobacteraceae bacterium]